MEIHVREESQDALGEYARIPIAFEVNRVFDVTARGRGLGGLVLTERALATPYVKNYDTASEGPDRWADRFDLTNWGFFSARARNRWVGAAAIAFDTPGVDMLGGRRDVAVMWDLRVEPSARGQGVGSALFRAAEAWAAARGCRYLKVETQNVNVGACRFYARMGCVLGGIDCFAFPDLLDEVQLLSYKALRTP